MVPPPSGGSGHLSQRVTLRTSQASRTKLTGLGGKAASSGTTQTGSGHELKRQRKPSIEKSIFELRSNQVPVIKKQIF